MDTQWHYGKGEPETSLRSGFAFWPPSALSLAKGKAGPRARSQLRAGVCPQQCERGTPPWNKRSAARRLAPPHTYRSCSVRAALFSGSGTGSGWGSRQPGGTLVQPAQRHGVMRALLPLCFWMKTAGIQLTDVNHKWGAGLHWERGSKHCTHHGSHTRGRFKSR